MEKILNEINYYQINEINDLIVSNSNKNIKKYKIKFNNLLRKNIKNKTQFCNE